MSRVFVWTWLNNAAGVGQTRGVCVLVCLNGSVCICAFVYLEAYLYGTEGTWFVAAAGGG